MKESYGQGLATHTGPGSCGDVREDAAEASTGVRAGRVFSRERPSLRGADAVRRGGRPHPISRHGKRDADPRAVRDLVHARKHHAGEPGDPGVDRGGWGRGPCRKAYERTPMMHDSRKSDSSVVPGKSSNEAGRPAEETAEGRGLTEGNSPQQHASRTLRRVDAPKALERVR